MGRCHARVCAALLTVCGVLIADPAAAETPDAPELPTIVQVAVQDRLVVAGDRTKVWFHVTDADRVPLASADVTVSAREWGAAAYTPLGVVRTDASGNGSFPVTVRRQTSYAAIADGVAASALVKVAAHVGVSSPRSGAATSPPAVVGGRVTPPASAVSVGVGFVRSSGYTYLGRTRTDAAGGFRLSVRPPVGSGHLVVYAAAYPGAQPGRVARPLTVRPPRPALYLTFDDGPHPTWTAPMLDMLRRHGAKATFCVVGDMARRWPHLVRRVVAEGHSLCNHSMSHDDRLPTRPLSVIRSEIGGAMPLLTSAGGGVRPRYYRAPGGAWSATVERIAWSYDLAPLKWHIDPGDFRRPGARVIAARILADARPGAVVVLHDGGGDRSQTIAAVDLVLTRLAQQGYRFAGLSR